MKKILVFFLVFLATLSCSSEDDIGNAIDPIIGVWNAIDSFDDFIDEDETIPVTFNFEFNLTFSADGTGSRNFTISTTAPGGEISNYDETEAFTWENTASNPDFDSINQTYILTFTNDGEIYNDLLTVTFSADFN